MKRWRPKLKNKNKYIDEETPPDLTENDLSPARADVPPKRDSVLKPQFIFY